MCKFSKVKLPCLNHRRCNGGTGLMGIEVFTEKNTTALQQSLNKL